MGFFDSPRERQAPGLYNQQMGSYDDILNAIQGMQSATSGVSDVGSLRQKFGLDTAANVYAPAKRNLATKKAQALSGASERMGSNVATPEAIFGGVESQYAGAAGELESQQAQANIGEEEYSAGLLDKIFNAQDQFGFQKQGMRLQGQGAKVGAISNYLGALSNASSFDDILAGLGTASKFIKPFKL